MRAPAKLLAIIILFPILFSAVTVTYAQSTIVDDAQNSVHDAYTALVDAYNAGANINQLTEELNQAINLTSQAQALLNSDPQQAQDLAAQAQAIAQNVTDQASAAKEAGLMDKPLVLAASVVALLVGGVAVYFFGPKLFWRVWFAVRKNYHIKSRTSNSQNKSLVITGEQVCAVILGIAIIIAFFAAASYFMPRTSEQFSELGVLGPNMQLADYPSEIVVRETVNLYVYVGNQMGKPMYYDVMVKLGDNNTTVDPASVAPIQEFYGVVPNNGTWIFPVDVTLTQPGLNQRIIFELWIYNETLNQNQYHERWGQIWLNVTAPAT
jgi:predicted PurR-regulated permease PerM